MKILVGDKGNIDFDGPIPMSSGRKKEFLMFMRSLFDIVTEEEGEEFRSDRLGEKFFGRSWTSDELKILLEIEDTNRICERLGRSWLSVDIKRGEFMPEFMRWAHQKGCDIMKEDTKKLIEEFMAEREEEKSKRRLERMEKRNEPKELEKKREDLLKMLQMIDIRIQCGQRLPEDDEIIVETKKELKEAEERLRQLDESDI